MDLFAEEERKQLRLDGASRRKRLGEIAGEIEKEPQRVQQSYKVAAHRLEPVGLVYLWPVTG